MKRYDFPQLQKSHSVCLGEILLAGKLDPTHRFIDLPDDFECAQSPLPEAMIIGGVANRKISGLGDAIALIARPIAGIIDRVAGTNLRNCGGCQRRRENLNRLVSFSNPPERGRKQRHV